MVELTAEEARVIGALVEKQLTTPQQYPLTLNGLLAACNQTSSRNPVVSYDERTVESTLAALKARGLVRFVHPSHGRSVTRYRQVLEEALGLETRQLALLAVLLLRGPQTVGELRTRTERMAPFDSLAEVEAELAALAGRDEPLVGRMPRVLGRDVRYTQLLAVTGAEERAAAAAGDAATAPAHQPGGAPSLAAQVAELKEEVAALRRDLDALIEQLGA